MIDRPRRYVFACLVDMDLTLDVLNIYLGGRHLVSGRNLDYLELTLICMETCDFFSAAYLGICRREWFIWPTDYFNRTPTERLMSHEKNAVLRRKVEKLMLRQIPIPSTQSALWCRVILVLDYALRMNFDLIDCGHDSGNVNYSLRFENVEIRKTCA